MKHSEAANTAPACAPTAASAKSASTKAISGRDTSVTPYASAWQCKAARSPSAAAQRCGRSSTPRHVRKRPVRAAAKTARPLPAPKSQKTPPGGRLRRPKR